MRGWGWAFFALVVVVLVGYVLNRGIYIGYTMTSYRVGDRTFFLKNCRYLHLSGHMKYPLQARPIIPPLKPTQISAPAQKFKVRQFSGASGGLRISRSDRSNKPPFFVRHVDCPVAPIFVRWGITQVTGNVICRVYCCFIVT